MTGSKWAQRTTTTKCRRAANSVALPAGPRERPIAGVGRWMEGQRRAGHTLAVTHPAVIRAAILGALQGPPKALGALR